jgi:16S rRNA (uracil1498-N3)-methyltransferase
VTEAAAEALRRAAAHVVVDDVSTPVLDDPSSHHVFRVLRVGDGEFVTVTDGAGNWRVCRAVAGTIEPEGEPQFERPPLEPLTIAFAIPKQDRPEWIVQKLTELGVDRVVLLHAQRSVVRWDAARADRHLARLRRVALEAVQQSRRVWIPTIEGPAAAIDVLPGAVAAEPGCRPIARTDRTIAIGPEGGWAPAELAAARDHVSLGPTVLRVETAALAAAVRASEHSTWEL